jgi:hypothetical protein
MRASSTSSAPPRRLLAGMTFALCDCMIAAALIPLLFILGLVALFISGAGSMSGFPAFAVIALLIGLAMGLARMLAHMDDERRMH